MAELKVIYNVRAEQIITIPDDECENLDYDTFMANLDPDEAETSIEEITDIEKDGEYFEF